MITTEGGNFEKCEAAHAGDLGSVSDSYFYDLAWADLAFIVVDLNRSVFAIVVDFLYRVIRGHQRRILQVEDLARGLADEEVFKVKALLVQRHERVFADGAQLDNFRQLASAFLNFHN